MESSLSPHFLALDGCVCPCKYALLAMCCGFPLLLKIWELQLTPQLVPTSPPAPFPMARLGTKVQEAFYSDIMN